MKKNYILTVCLSLIFSAASFGQYSDLFISMYAEGSSNNKFIEIFNGTGSDVDLSDYMIKGSNNGNELESYKRFSVNGYNC
ncbi:lamin tail domain-containing protein [uncultured Polaribacter sp.]|uniref:lamin tail domain-containing protein n=1 Tax=uncultured Polaribacter sp. TaxID=174711 RepID=UPI002633DE44|nr:lamin tail domain-containing protein [uncultured Polaribacter sp.]